MTEYVFNAAEHPMSIPVVASYNLALRVAARQAFEFAQVGTGRGPLHKAGILGSCILLADNPDYLEIGTQYGRTAILAGTLTRGHVYCIDPMEDLDDPDGEYGPGKRAHQGETVLFKRNLREFNVADRVTLIKEKSNPWPLAEDFGPIGVSYVDGDHSYEGALWDLVQVAKITTHYIVMDDHLKNAGAMTRGVREAIQTFLRTADKKWALIFADHVQAVLMNTETLDEQDPDNVTIFADNRWGHYAVSVVND